jgi:hypothetical protein
MGPLLIWAPGHRTRSHRPRSDPDRRSNVDAHNLARSSIHASLGRHVWLLDPPEGVCKNFDVS